MNVELRNIHKTFGKVHANDGISLTVPSGTIQGILGENGAGKSTLMKILSGFIQADQGEILLDGQPVKIVSPADAIQHGIGMLHQDPLDFPPMRVIDNFLIGHKEGIFPNRAAAIRSIRELQTQFGFSIDPDAYVDTLTVGERQQLEILRLLWLGARVLILDEPTTGISALQKEKLFATLKKLAEQGITLIFVSHKLEDVEGLCHHIAVFCRGKLVGEASPPYQTEELVKMMFGKVVSLGVKAKAPAAKCLLKLSHFAIEDYRVHTSDVNLEVCQGEVIGLAGMEGSGQRQFLRTLAGLMRPTDGKMFLEERNLTGKAYQQFLKAGVAYVPAARLEEGLIPGLTLLEHFILAEKSEGFVINRDKALAVTQERIQDFSIRGTANSRIEALSGGNQQRALLALLRDPLRLLLMEHPTRGLDIESAIWIWGKLKERCRQGTTILFISADLEEILHYSDRILVFFGGKVSKPMDAASMNVDQLGQMIGGKGW
ncbi:MAG TPA: ATP-binding cassette domain-containing protein [Anaerolineaceae bacterium]|jgi:simple sugar transport system ATP-binding protein|nr:ATP-binding cassette domain-containing protein [Anaerolineaceae bacterium]